MVQEVRPRWRWAWAVPVLLLLGALGGTIYLTAAPEPKAMPPGGVGMSTASAPTPAAAPGAAETGAPAPSAQAAPSFDVVRVGPTGNAVIAGRAEPGAEVVVRDGAQEIARAQADRQGAFVAIPSAPLAEGGRSLTLATPGPVEHRSEAAVVVVVPPRAAAAQTEAQAQAQAQAQAPVAVLVPQAAPPRVLQEAKAGGPVGLDTVDYDEAGRIRFTGHAAPGSALRVYVDNKPAGEAVAEAAGRWVLAPGDAVAPGVHALRVDRLDAVGRVTARVELPFERSAVPVAELAAGRIVVQPGQNLWRMARTAYGSGVRYTVIYLANRDQIRDPRRIYPGQAFAVPPQ